MAGRLPDGTYRIRRRVPGWRDGELIMRLGTRSKRLAERWEKIAMDAYQESQHEILDALVDREISIPEAIRLHREGGWPAIRDAIDAKRAANARPAYDAEQLLAEFVKTNPRGVNSKTMRGYATHNRAFISWLKRRYAVSTVDPTEFFTRDTVREFRDDLIKKRHDAVARRLKKTWRAMGDAAPSRVERERILERDHGGKGSTANRYVNSIGSFSVWLVEKGILSESPAVGVRMTTRAENPTRERTYRYFTPEELRIFLEYSRRYDEENPVPSSQPAPDTLFWRFLVATGATTHNEGGRFCLRHLYLDRESEGMVPCYIHGTKTSYRPREVYMPVSLAHDLVARARELGIEEGGLLFPFTHDEYLWRWGRVMRLIRKERPEGWEGVVRHRPYDLRHTFAVNAVRAGVDLEQLRQLMGHADISTTQIYARHQQSPQAALRRMAAELDLA